MFDGRCLQILVISLSPSPNIRVLILQSLVLLLLLQVFHLSPFVFNNFNGIPSLQSTSWSYAVQYNNHWLKCPVSTWSVIGPFVIGWSTGMTSVTPWWRCCIKNTYWTRPWSNSTSYSRPTSPAAPRLTAFYYSALSSPIHGYSNDWF